VAAASSVIEARGLRKRFRKLRRPPTVAVDGLDLDVPAGGVFGFLGPNGSGKTTTIRLILGMHRPTEGEVRLFGRPVPAGLPESLKGVGAIVEAPALHPGLTGRRNLEILATIAGIPRPRIDEVLETVDLTGRDKDSVKTYSLGMKQRLAIAAALLKDPPLLILDEPANGLDPAGIREVRQLIRRLGDEGRTVFLSSHQLHEVQQVCDAVAILAKGRLIAAGSVRDVLSGGRAAEYRVTLPAKRAAAAKALRAAGFDARRDGDDLLVVASGPKDAARITRTLADAGVYLSGLRPEEASLEAAFLELTEPPPA
jgi:ABC-2 type transport system ATP-binding protein